MFDINNLKKIRISLGLTQNEFSKKANVSQSLIAKIESNRVDPTYSKVKQIEEALNLLSSKKEPPIDNLMTKIIITAKPSDKAIDVIKLMSSKNVSQIPILDGHNVVGLISESSALENFEKLKNSSAKDIMSEAPPIISFDTRIAVISDLLKHYPIVLVKKKGILNGVITKSDLLSKALN